jgi:RNA polymerase sigma-70 factor (ECF subfamily)
VTSRAELDLAVEAHCAAADHRAAATAILEALGAHVVRVIHARFHDDQSTAEVFSLFAEDLWLGLAKFRFECSVRAWVFLLARNAGNRYLARDLRKRRAQVPLSQAPELAAHAARIRTQTLLNLSTPREQRLNRLRSELSVDDQELLTLRVDRELDFAEIALVTLGDAQARAEEVTRESARLRKRFQLLKDRLRKRWQEITRDEENET